MLSRRRAGTSPIWAATITFLAATFLSSSPAEAALTEPSHGLEDRSSVESTHVSTFPGAEPVAVNDAASTFKNVQKTIDVLANDFDPDGDDFFIVEFDAISAQSGSVVCEVIPGGQCTYTPPAGFTGIDTFTYKIIDTTGKSSDAATVAVTVTNRPPNAVADADSTLEGQPVTHNVLGNDSDPDGDPLTVTGNTQGSNGATVDCLSTGACTYTPATGFTGTDTFQYTVSDGTDTDTGTVTIKVKSLNSPPVATDDADTTAQDTPVVIDVLGNDSDPDGDPLTVDSNSDALNGSVDCSAATSCTYEPNAGFTGNDQFTYRAGDGRGGVSNSATVRIAVIETTPTNQPPVAVNDVAAAQKNTPRVILVLTNDSDPDGDPLTVTSAGPAAHGTVVVNSNNTVTYTPNTDFVGSDSFSYSISDGQGGTDTAMVSVTVSDTPPPNRAPNAVNDTATTPRDQARTINVLANDSDPDGDPLTITAVSDPPHGQAVAGVGGNITYTPDSGFTGGDAFTYTISDGRGESDNATVTVTVTAPSNQPPAAVIDSPGGDVTIAPGGTVSFTGTGTDADGTIVAFAWTFSGGSPASSALEDPGSVTFAAAGTFTVTFNVIDNGGASDPTPAQRTIHVVEGGGGGDGLDVDKSSPGSAGRVDGHDVLFVLRAIGTQDPSGDVNADGRVDRADVNLVLEALGDEQ